MIHSYDSKVAELIGVKGAVLLNHLHWWVEKNRANEMNFYDGHYWTYNSSKAYGALFPYWTPKTIQRELQKLEQDGYIKTGCFNKKSTDRTKWYTLTDKGAALINKEQDKLSSSIGQKCPMHWSKMSNGKDKNDLSSYNSNKTDSREHSSSGACAREGTDDDLSKIIDFCNANVEIVTPFKMQLLESYLEDYGYEWVQKALEKVAAMGRDKRNTKYVGGVLNGWKNDGVPKPWEKSHKQSGAGGWQDMAADLIEELEAESNDA